MPTGVAVLDDFRRKRDATRVGAVQCPRGNEADAFVCIRIQANGELSTTAHQVTCEQVVPITIELTKLMAEMLEFKRMNKL